MDLKDCLTFPKYEQFPPTYVLRYHGINPVVSLLLKILRCQPIQLSQSCFYSWILNSKLLILLRFHIFIFKQLKKNQTDKTNANMNFFFQDICYIFQFQLNNVMNFRLKKLNMFREKTWHLLPNTNCFISL